MGIYTLRGASLVLTAAALSIAAPAAQQTCTVSASQAGTTSFGYAFERSGGPGTIRITASTSTCAWTASPAVGWITLTGATSGIGSAYIPFEVAPMPVGTSVRNGNVIVGGTSVAVQQGIGGVIGAIESPTPGTYVTPFTIHGWAMADNGTSNTAVVDLYYTRPGSFTQTFLGAGAMGEPRQHIADRWGSAYLGSGYSLDVPSLPAGSYGLSAYAKNAPNSFYWIAGSVQLTVVDPVLSLNVSQVRAAAVRFLSGISSATPSQPVIVSRIGRAPWTAVPQQPWITVSPASGTGDGRFMVSFDFSSVALPAGGILAGTIRVNAAGVPGGTIDLPVFVTVYQSGGTSKPFGAFESPADGATALNGAFGVTGWALDDVGIRRVQIFRDPVASEPQNSLILIGDAPLVEGARPDVAQAFPEFPSSTAAGWGYMLLSNMLPSQGNGTFKLYAFAYDNDAPSAFLGAKTVTIDNASSGLPFGTLDFPGQGEIVSGLYTSQGWVLTPQPAALRPDGSLCAVFIDGQFVGRPVLGISRPDVAALFPGLYNTSIAGGKYTFDTRYLKNGVHTIAWSVIDSLGRVQGIGSRYFIVNNP